MRRALGTMQVMPAARAGGPREDSVPAYSYERLSAQDNTFLLMERSNVYMHISATVIYKVGSLKTEDGIFSPSKILQSPFAHFSIEQAKHSGDRYLSCPKEDPLEAEDSLPIGPVLLVDDGLWQCYELVFDVETPSPRESFSMSVTVDGSNGEYMFSP